MSLLFVTLLLMSLLTIIYFLAKIIMLNNPKFSREDTHVYMKGEKIYVVDNNEFDIYEAVVQDIVDGTYKIHYPDYPDEDFSTKSTASFLVQNAVNNEIYEQQEKIRRAKEASAPAEDQDNDDIFKNLF